MPNLFNANQHSGSDDGTLRLWDLETGACLAAFIGDAATTRVAVVRDDLFVAGSRNGAIHICCGVAS